MCTENLIRIDLPTESLNVGREGRGDMLLVGLAVKSNSRLDLICRTIVTKPHGWYTGYSTLMLAVRITPPHFAISSR